MPDPVTACVPIDPTASALHHVQRGTERDVWRWLPHARAWGDTCGGRMAAGSAFAAGWRVTGVVEDGA